MPIFLAGKPALASGSTGVVVVGHGKLLFERERAREAENGRRRERERNEEEWAKEGARGVERASERAGGSLLVHPGKTRPHRQPLYVDPLLDPLFGIADFFLSLSLPLFSIRTRRPL